MSEYNDTVDVGDLSDPATAWAVTQTSDNWVAPDRQQELIARFNASKELARRIGREILGRDPSEAELSGFMNYYPDQPREEDVRRYWQNFAHIPERTPPPQAVANNPAVTPAMQRAEDAWQRTAVQDAADQGQLLLGRAGTYAAETDPYVKNLTRIAQASAAMGPKGFDPHAVMGAYDLARGATGESLTPEQQYYADLFRAAMPPEEAAKLASKIKSAETLRTAMYIASVAATAAGGALAGVGVGAGAGAGAGGAAAAGATTAATTVAIQDLARLIATGRLGGDPKQVALSLALGAGTGAASAGLSQGLDAAGVEGMPASIMKGLGELALQAGNKFLSGLVANAPEGPNPGDAQARADRMAAVRDQYQQAAQARQQSAQQSALQARQDAYNRAMAQRGNTQAAYMARLRDLAEQRHANQEQLGTQADAVLAQLQGSYATRTPALKPAADFFPAPPAPAPQADPFAPSRAYHGDTGEFDQSAAYAGRLTPTYGSAHMPAPVSADNPESTPQGYSPALLAYYQGRPRARRSDYVG